MKLVVTGAMKGGKLAIHQRKRMLDALRGWRDCPVCVTVERQHATRSLPQNDYYWAVVVARVQAAFQKRHALEGRDPQITHELLKAQFQDPELVRRGDIRGWISDDGLTLGTSTTELNRLQFMDYLDRIIDHAALHWDCYIPPPDPLWREHAEEDNKNGEGGPAPDSDAGPSAG